MKTRRIALAWGGIFVLALALFGGWRFARTLSLEGPDTLPRGFPIATPAQPVLPMDLREDYSDEIVQSLLPFSERLRARDGEGAIAWLSPRFAGHTLSAAGGETTDLGLGATLTRDAIGARPVLDRTGFIASIDERLRDWRRIDEVHWEVVSAEFQQGRPLWGRAVLDFAFLGAGPKGEPRSIRGRGTALVAKRGGSWTLEGFELSSLEERSRPAPIFTEVTAASGLSAQGVRWGRPPNVDFSWNGAAVADVNGDGLWDIFLPSRPRNFLYVARPDGGFVDEAEARGVGVPGGGTGAVFFDFDNDGDLDLAVANDSHLRRDGALDGGPLRFYRHEGAGDAWRFREVGREVGFDDVTHAYSLVVFDYDGDGYLDVFVVNYAPERSVFPDAWIDARNGTADLLYHNLGGRRFEEVAERAGVADRRWGYAAAAADYDRDGHPDLYVANDFGLNALWRNEGNGTFTDVAGAAGSLDRGFGMSVAWGDLDNDGRLDLYVSNMSSVEGSRILDRLSVRSPSVDALRKMAAGNSILLFRDGRFEASPASRGGVDCAWAWGALPLDLDLDGRLDIFCTNGYITGRESGDAESFYWRHVVASSIEAELEPSLGAREPVSAASYKGGHNRLIFNDGRSLAGHQRDHLWRNAGQDGFVDLSDVSGADSQLDGRAVVAADFDDDGDVDLFVHEMEGERHRLYRNDAVAAGAGFLKIRLRATKSQWQAIGAEVVVRGGSAGPCSQVLQCGSGYLSCQPPELVFGLGRAAAGMVEVFWPDGVHESFGRIPAASRVLLVEGAGKPAPFAPRPHPLERPSIH